MEIKEVKTISPVGRPKVDDPKTKRFSVCLDNETEEKLKIYCEQNNITKGEAIRKGIHLLLQQKSSS